MPAESVIERLRERMRHPQSHYFTMDTADVVLLLAVADAAERHCTDHKILMPTGCVCRVCSAVRALRAGGSHD